MHDIKQRVCNHFCKLKRSIWFVWLQVAVCYFWRDRRGVENTIHRKTNDLTGTECKVKFMGKFKQIMVKFI